MLKDTWLRFRMIEGCGGGVDVGFVMIMMFDDVLFLVFDVWWWRHFSGFFQHHRQVEDDAASTDVSSTVIATLSSCQQWAQALLLSSHLSRSPFRHIKSRPGTSVICHVFMFVWQFLLFQYTNKKTSILIPMLNYIWIHINISIVITSIDLPIRIPLLQKAMELFQRQRQKGRQLDVTTLRHWDSGAQVPLYI